jgi:WS/DGAT/MGAT family acyltransferase
VASVREDGRVLRRDPTISRATAEDLVLLASDVGPAPMQVGAVLRLAGALDASIVEDEINRRIVAIPRLRQRFEAVPIGCGRPIWVDDPSFALGDHLRFVDLGGTGDEAEMLAVATEVVETPLPANEPLWRMAVLSGLRDGGSAVVVAFHHLLSDGIGGLAMLASLVEGAEPIADPAWPRSAPSRARLAIDALRSRLNAVRSVGTALRRVRAAVIQLRPGDRSAGAPRCSLNAPTGAHRRVALVRAPLEDVRDAAHAAGVTINDLVLTAVVASLGALLARRGEHVDELVVSVPVSGRDPDGAAELGNQVGAVPVALPVAGEASERLRATAAATFRAKQGWRGASNALLGPLFRLLGALRLFRWFVEHQHLVNTFVTNLKGPQEQLGFLGAPITEVAAITIVPGNVTVCFAVLSYAGTLVVSVVADPARCGELDWLHHELDRQLGSLLGEGPDTTAADGA